MHKAIKWSSWFSLNPFFFYLFTKVNINLITYFKAKEQFVKNVSYFCVKKLSIIIILKNSRDNRVKVDGKPGWLNVIFNCSL